MVCTNGTHLPNLIFNYLNLYIQNSKMGFFSNIFGKKPAANEPSWRVGGTEDFMMLIRVYYQAVMAANFGLRDFRMLPDLRVFKQTMKVPTVNNRIGIGEKNRCRKMLQEIYGISDNFFQEIDASIKHRCKNLQAMQTYMMKFQGFAQELMMLMGNLMKWKFRLPGFLKGALLRLTEKSINDVMTRNNWKEADVQKSVASVRRYAQTLGYSQQWMTEFVYNVIILAKKEPKPDATAES